MIPPTLFFFLEIVLAICSLVCFHTNFRIIYSSSGKNFIGILIGVILNLQIALGSMVIFTMLIILICEHSIYFHLFVSFSISFISVIYLEIFFLLSQTYSQVILFFFFQVILFDTIANEIVFLILFLTIYCQCIEIQTFLYMNFASCNFTEFIEFSSFWWCRQDFSMFIIMSYANSGSFASSFPIWMTFIYFSDLIVMSRTFQYCVKQKWRVQASLFYS